MADSTLSFVSTSTFRNSLMAKNLAPYSVPGAFSPPAGNINYETNLSNLNVVNSPDELIANDPFAQQLYPLNQYGPPGGYDININYNNVAQQTNPNQGEYDINDADIDLVNEFYIDAAFIENIYGPEGGFNDLYVVDSIQNNNRIYLPYWDPPTFSPSTYTPYEILFSDNPVGDNGSLSQDSFIAKIGAQTLRSLFRDRINAEIYQNTVGLVNLESLSDPFEASLILTGQEPLIYRNWRITVPENPLLAAADFLTRIGGAYFPVSPIPGDYFQENELNGGSSTQISNALNVVNQLTGGWLGPILNKTRNPSEIFLANTGNGQRSALFANINYNRYKPGYNSFGGLLGIAQAAANLFVDLINPDNGSLNGGYYVGSRNAEPSTIDSPPNQLPVDPYGRQIQTPVYGPTELSKVYEGNEDSLRFGLAGKSFSNGGGIDGQFVWVSPKYKDAAGYKATVGGGVGSADNEFNLISGQYLENESTNLTLKEGSILDDTQRIIDSADNVSGIARLKHVGNAMNQVSKVFNDGYREITKGSRVVSYVDNTTGAEAGIEYCRVFTKDTPYYTYADLQKTDGITTSGRRFVNSVFDNTYNLNIAPLRNPGSTNILPNAKGDLHAKKYMFSIENLAWRTSSRPGFTYDDLPICEKGPNGGRVMWFPPYDIKFSDSSSSSFNSTTFLGRPEPIYTYKETSRSGTLSWKIIVDHPSVMNTIVEKQLKGVPQERIDSIIDSFFAGCVKFDIYELAKKFNTIPISQLYTYQEILNNPRLTEEELININKEIPKAPTVIGPQDGTTGVQNNVSGKALTNDETAKEFEKKYLELGFYFFNDIPDPNTRRETSTVPFDVTYRNYSAATFVQQMEDTANATFPENSNFCKKNTEYCSRAVKVKEFFTNVIQNNFNQIAVNESNFIVDAYNILKEKKGTITISMLGSASAPADPTYNVSLSKRRIDSVKKFFKNYKIGDATLGPYLDDGTFKIVSQTGRGENIVIPKGDLGTGFEVNCTKNITGGTGTVTSNSQIYSVNAMACRRVKIASIDVIPTPDPEPIVDIVKKPEVIPPPNVETIPVPKPKPTVDVIKKLKEGISKQILRSLFSECDYFDIIKEEVPMLYNTFKEKIRYFNPAFHSTTPEGLNARLTFLNQCVRPGETIPTIGTDGQPKYNDAVNTSFGAPPILVLRIGDFYHTKIVPDGVSFTYEPLTFDLNPEGIGIQPMIVNVSMNFKIIGGMGLAKPVEQLQNALSFNYYANTEIYDERAVPTEDTSALDKQVVDAILAGQVPATLNDVPNQQSNDAGNTIGDIITNIPVASGQTGEITYQRLMDQLITDTRGYIQLVTNKMETLNNAYNFGIIQMLSINRKFNQWDINTPVEIIELYGKATGWEDEIKYQFDKAKENISLLNNPLMIELTNSFGTDVNSTPLREVIQNMKDYLDSLSQTYNNDIAMAIQEMVEFQQNYVYLLRKINLISTATDGKILENNQPRVYNISGTSGVSKSSVYADGTVPLDTFEELKSDYNRLEYTLMDSKDGFNSIIGADGYFFAFSNVYSRKDNGCFFYVTDDKKISTIPDLNFFLLMARVITDKNKRDEFINFVIKGSIANYNSPVSLRNKFEKAVDNLEKIYSKELEAEKNKFNQFKNSSKFKNLTDGITDIMYSTGKLRKFDYTTVPGPNNETQKQNIIDLYRNKIIFN
jgi:hypothetical protein